MENNIVKSIAEFVLKNWNHLPVYVEVQGEKKMFETVDDALNIIGGEQVSSFILKDKNSKVLGEVCVGDPKEYRDDLTGGM